MARINCDADACAQVHVLAERLLEDGGDLLGYFEGPYFAVLGGKQYGELIAPETRSNLARLQVICEPVDQFAQRLVTGGMSHVVIDPFEAVEVDEEAGELLLVDISF